MAIQEYPGDLSIRAPWLRTSGSSMAGPSTRRVVIQSSRAPYCRASHRLYHAETLIQGVILARGNLSTITVDKFVGKILTGRVSLLFVTLFSCMAIF